MDSRDSFGAAGERFFTSKFSRNVNGVEKRRGKKTTRRLVCGTFLMGTLNHGFSRARETIGSARGEKREKVTEPFPRKR